MHYLSRFKSALPGETKAWVFAGLVNEQQASKICQRYGLDYNSQLSLQQKAQRTLLLLAALFAGAALLVLVQYNWYDIPRVLRMSALLLLTMAVNGAGVWFFRQDGYLSTRSEALLLFGSIAYGTSIMLIAQIYNIGEYYPDGIFYWALGTMLVAVVSGSKSIAILAAVLVYIWGIVENYNAVLYMTMFPVFLIAIALVLRQRASKLLAFVLLYLGVGWWYGYTAWVNGAFHGKEYGGEQILITISLPLLLYTLSGICNHPMAGGMRQYEGMLSKLLPLAMIVAYLCARHLLEPLYYGSHWHVPENVYAVIVLLAIAALASMRWRKTKCKLIPTVAISLYLLATSILVAPHFGLLPLSYGQEYGFVVAYLLAIVVAYLAFSIECLKFGEARRDAFYYYVGIVAIIVLVVDLYIELFDASYVITSLMLATFAAFMYFMSHRWRKLASTRQKPS